MSAGRSLRTVSLLSTVISFTGVTGGDCIAAAIARSAALRTLSSRTRVLLLRAFSIPTHILTLSASSALALRAVSTPAVSLSCSSLLSLLSALTRLPLSACSCCRSSAIFSSSLFFGLAVVQSPRTVPSSGHPLTARVVRGISGAVAFPTLSSLPARRRAPRTAHSASLCRAGGALCFFSLVLLFSIFLFSSVSRRLIVVTPLIFFSIISVACRLPPAIISDIVI
eukprot:COSAG06_NODE_22_length_33148_cov_102.016279_15_plen_225_part_00